MNMQKPGIPNQKQNDIKGVKKIKILIVDDNKDNIYLLETLLQSNGYKVQFAYNGSEALKKLAQDNFHLIISDILMPVMDGFQFCRLCKENKQFREIPFIFYTATYTDNKDEQFAKQLGVNKYIRKPIDSAELLKVVEEVIYDGQTKNMKIKIPPIKKDDDIFKLYNERLVQKLEHTKQVLEKEVADRKKAEIEARQAQREWELIFQAIGHPTMILDINHKIIQTNKATEIATGKTKKQLTGKKCFEILHDKNDPAAVCPMEKALKSKNVTTIGMELEALNGSYLVSCTPVLNKAGKIDRIIHIATDISDRVQAEEALKESEERYRGLFENAVLGLYKTTPDGQIIVANPTLVKMLGYSSLEELAKRNLEEGSFEPDYPRSEFKKRISRDGMIMGFESAWHKKDGAVIYVSESAIIVRDEHGGIIAYEGTVEDITKRKLMEKALIGSEEKYSSVVENSNDAIIIHQQGIIKFANQPTQQITGFSVGELIGKNIMDFVHPDYRELILKYHANRLSGKDIPNLYEIDIVKKDKTIIPVEVNATLINFGGQKSGLVFFRDIQKRKQAERKIKTSLKEKEILLKEIHHRVKNNLQVLASLLNIQSAQMNNEEVREIFRKNIQRISSIAQVHEKLYVSKNFASINFKEYIETVSAELFNSYRIESQIDLETDLEDISLGLDDAIPCGLIINELITNSLKYAFPNKEKGKIKISLKKETDDLFQLIVQDNGIGVPEGFDFEQTKSFGLHLVKILSEQINGEATLENKNGTIGKINFKGYNFGKSKNSHS
jgi:PAS domain S-box-containing protein